MAVTLPPYSGSRLAAIFLRWTPDWFKDARRRRAKREAIKLFRQMTRLFGQYLQTMSETELAEWSMAVAALVVKPGVNQMEANERFLAFVKALRDIQLIIDD